MALGLDRRRRAGGYLAWKVRFFSVGAALAMAGIYLQERWMTLTAMPVLLAGMLVRFLPNGSEEDDPAAEEDDPSPVEGDAESE